MFCCLHAPIWNIWILLIVKCNCLFLLEEELRMNRSLILSLIVSEVVLEKSARRLPFVVVISPVKSWKQNPGIPDDFLTPGFWGKRSHWEVHWTH